ncbi:GNAT family N-acetyltransferase [Saccharopolyspora sp. SCSIO 74807]
MAANADEIVITKVAPDDIETVEASIALGNRSKKTLGMLPHAAYYGYAEKGGLLTAVIGGAIVGYALFQFPRNEVSLTHLCVHPENRRRGVAQLLVTEISRRHSDKLGVRAKCRDDYEMDDTWRSLGFTKRASTLGRGKDAAAMTVWWRDHGHPDLFTQYDELSPLAVVADVNVLLDLFIRPEHPRAADSRMLLADHLVDRLEVVTTRGLDRDLARHPSDDQENLRKAAASCPRKEGPPWEAEQLYELLLSDVVRDNPGFPKNDQDVGDLWQLAEAAVCGAGAFVTWDEALIRRFGPIVRERTGLRVMSPDRVITRLDELANFMAYQPEALHDGRYTTVQAASDSEDELLGFLNADKGERKKEFRDHLRWLARSQFPHWIIHGPDQRAVACYAGFKEGSVYHVPLLRIVDHPIVDTLARHLIWEIRQAARRQGAKVVDISDAALPSLVARFAEYDGLRHIDGHWYAWIVNRCGTSLEVTAEMNAARNVVKVGSGVPLQPNLGRHAVAEFERSHWPAKVIDGELPCFAVAIQPRWSAELFGEPRTLTPRGDQLSLGVDHVYYRSPKNGSLAYPARILWYMSENIKMTGKARFIGTSLLYAVNVGDAAEMHTALRNYGVFRVADVQGAADQDGRVQVLRFSNTELFTNPVWRADYDTFGPAMGGPRNFLSPVRVSPALFAEIYRRGVPGEADDHP